MADTVIRVENLSKKYVLQHHHREKYATLREAISNAPRSIGRKVLSPGTAKPTRSSAEEFYALRDVSFDIQRGDRVGFIGRNGAGKSTLLKVLSRITEPTRGRIEITGRVASLLEVGTGFHPELTGRENIFLNGAVLGMGKSEIKRKFDEIVDFSEVERFLDTPVKRYSSGMYVRLAFAVAAHLEPEILIVDEVLAVGDADFQRKCLGKMDAVSREGRTVLFVSHNMDAIERLCDRAIWLHNGSVAASSDAVSTLVKKYLFGVELLHSSSWTNDGAAPPNPYFEPKSVELMDPDGNLVQGIFSNDARVNLLLEADIGQPDKTLNVGYVLYSESGTTIYQSFSTDAPEDDWPKLSAGRNRIVTELPRRMLNEGRYILEVIASLYEQRWLLEPGKSKCSISFQISGGLSDSPFWFASRPGLLAPVLIWKTLPLPQEIRGPTAQP